MNDDLNPLQWSEQELKERQIVKYRMEGKTFEVISDIMGYSGSGAVHNAYTSIMNKKYPETAILVNAAKNLQRNDLEHLRDHLMAKIASSSDRDLETIDRLLKVYQQQSKLDGLDAPIQTHNMNVNIDKSHEDWLDELDDPEQGDIVDVVEVTTNEDNDNK